MRLDVLEDQRFSCRTCSNCCRNWHVELLDDEIRALPALAWPEGDPCRSVSPFLKFSGRTYLAHAADGACVYLNRGNGRCRIHEQFGMEAKPLGCRLFPFQIARTFEGQVSVLGRNDCPAIRDNYGQPFDEQRRDIDALARELPLGPAFDPQVLDHLSREQVQAAVEFAVALLNAFPDDRGKVLFLYYFTDWLATQSVEGLSRETLGLGFPEIQGHVQKVLALPAGRVGAIHRLAFRALLAQHLRRDEDVVDGRAWRIPRAIAIARIVLGGGGLPGVGAVFPPGTIRQARLFTGDTHIATASGAFDLHWRMVRLKLASFQFMGRSAGRDFLNGLRGIALLYPFVVATARLRAAGRASAVVDAQDVDFAVGAIDHAVGRQPILRSPLARQLESFVLDPRAFPMIVRRV
ncbi:MAG: YkgJ family cysteine cluster protein [Planctomycetota bacterium]|nr:YkgJ family cysteine cluster protein [Planctomycetota bacterium]